MVAFVLNLIPLTLKSDELNGRDNALFKISRSKDANEIFYEVKTMPDGSLDLEEPIKIYWVKNTENGKTQPLTKIQQHFAYGLKFLEIEPEKAYFQFVSYSKRTLILRKNKYDNFGVFTEVKGMVVELERVFIQIDGGTFWFPKITHVEVHAKNTVANQLVVEIIKP
jgi:hypothetical protein